ncbi:MAG: glycosyltransferase family 9 protein [Capsulimonadales bacterium]|nr:glycosyltransferase family 9 protein [Capsulimonadales bacterium]
MPQSSPVVPPDDVRRLLLVKLSSLGDIVHALPLLDALRSGLGPDTLIAWAVRRKFSEILEGNPAISQSHILTGSGLSGLIEFGRLLRRERFDVTLDAQGLLLSGMVTWMSGAPTRIGLDSNREGNRVFLTHPVVPGRERIHVVRRLLGFCPALGLPIPPVCRQHYLALGQQQEAKEWLPVADIPIVGCIVGASTAAKTYPPDRWVEVARQFRRSGIHTLLLGGPAEAETASAIVAEVGEGVTDFTGKTPLRLLASVLAQCRVVVGGDSGPTHLAVAVGTPVVGLYGVTDPARTGPDWGTARSIVLDFAEKDAPPADRRPRHPTLDDALARIPPEEIVRATLTLFLR